MKTRILLLIVLLSSLAAFGQQPVNNAQVGGVAISTGNGTVGTGVQRVAIASDNTAFAVNATLSAETTKVIGTVNVAAAQTIAVTQGTAANLKASVNLNDGSGTAINSTSNSLNVNCTAGCTTGTTISLIPATTGGLSIGHLVAAATNNATALKGSAGQLYGASVYNNTTYPVYLKFCNKATACTCGTNTGSDTILYTVAAQAGTEREIHTEEGITFSTGISYCVVKGMADTDNTSLAASDAVVDLLYK